MPAGLALGIGGAGVVAAAVPDTLCLESDEKILAQIPLEYDSTTLEAYWSRNQLAIATRLISISAQLLPYAARALFEALFEYQKDEVAQAERAAQLREILTSLGPCFIKLGQALSIRPDILPSAYLYELQKLCDSVPSFPTVDAIRVIESELGIESVNDVFTDLGTNIEPPL